MLSYLLNAILAAALVRQCVNTLASILFSSSHDLLKPRSPDDGSDEILLVISVLEEDSKIRETALFFIEQCRWSSGVRILFVGTQAERVRRGGVSCIDRILDFQESGLVEIFEASENATSKSIQLNELVAKLQNKNEREKILCFLDIDTRIQVEEMFSELPIHDDEIVQFHTMFLQNFRALSYLQRGQALYQSRWTVCHEFRRLWLSKFTRYYAVLLYVA